MFNKGIGAILGILFRRLLKQPKLYLVAALLAAVLNEYTGSARLLPQQFNMHINAYGSFACLTSYSFLMLWITLGYLVLISDVPFASRLSLFESLRVTPRQSLAARMLYVLLTSILYVLFVFFLASLIQLASFTQPFKWDKALNTMSLGNAVGGTFLYTPRSIVAGYNPIQAWAQASGLLACVLASFGLAMLLGSLLINKKVMLCLTGAMATLDLAIGYMRLPGVLYYFSPLSWCRLEMLQNAGYYANQPSPGYNLAMPGGLLLLMCACAVCFLTKPKGFTQKMITLGGEIDD